MKKASLIIASICTLGLVSCDKCQDCEHSIAGSKEICESDYNSSTEYENVIAGYELVGYTCTAK